MKMTLQAFGNERWKIFCLHLWRLIPSRNTERGAAPVMYSTQLVSRDEGEDEGASREACRSVGYVASCEEGN